MTAAAALGLILSACALGQCLLSTSILLTRDDPYLVYRPLSVFFMANLLAELSAVAELLAHLPRYAKWITALDAISISAFFLIAPALWLYVRNVTNPSPSAGTLRLLRHLVPFAFALSICVLLLAQPHHVREAVIGDGDLQGSPREIVLTSLFLLLVLIWIVQCTVYLILMRKRLITNRAQLKDHFASTEGRELGWIFVIMILLVATLLFQSSNLFLNLQPRVLLISDALDFVMIFVVSLWGLRQTPVLISDGGVETGPILGARPEEDLSSTSASITKYEKSALDESHIDRIEAKIIAAMESQSIYLEPNLSLRDLASAISVPPNYVSQTLNGRIGETFYDFVNAYRVRAALPQIANTQKTILEIAYEVGFNSRSSFYKSFKREFGSTPSDYRKTHATKIA